MRRIAAFVLLVSALATPSLALASGGRQVQLRTTMTGRKAVPRGATRGRGSATVRISGRRVCWSFGRMRGIDKPRAAFIKKGIPGEFGPVMVQLGRGYRPAGCATTSAGTARAIAQSPRGFYLTVNTRKFPLGAVRGQLRKG
jgi:hypothetical protein